MPARTRRSDTRRRGSAGSPRGWLTLLVLVVAAGLISLGPGTIKDMLAGVFFTRPPAATVKSPLPHPDDELQRKVQAAGSLSRGRLTASIIGLDDGASATVDADQAQAAASLFKVPILVQVLADADAGRLNENSTLEVRQEDWTDGSGVLQARVGEKISIRELERLMIGDSDNIAALMLLNAVTALRVNTTMEALGLRSTHVVDHRAGETDDHTTSAADMTRLMLLLASGQAIGPRISERALGELEAKQHSDWLSAGLPFWIKVAHKWGDLPQARNDAGIIFSPRASYAITVMTDGAEPSEAAEAIGRVSRAAYAYLSAGR